MAQASNQTFDFFSAQMLLFSVKRSHGSSTFHPPGAEFLVDGVTRDPSDPDTSREEGHSQTM